MAGGCETLLVHKGQVLSIIKKENKGNIVSNTINIISLILNFIADSKKYKASPAL